jgi:phosphoribosylformylglycinamidine (FGAM) synthase-like enzyme
MPNYNIQKSSIPVIYDENGKALAIILFNENRDRVIYMIEKADEDEIIALFERQNLKIKETKTED